MPVEGKSAMVFQSLREASEFIPDMSPKEFIRVLRKAADRLEEIGISEMQSAAIFGIASVCYSHAYRGVTQGWHEAPTMSDVSVRLSKLFD